MLVTLAEAEDMAGVAGMAAAGTAAVVMVVDTAAVVFTVVAGMAVAVITGAAECEAAAGRVSRAAAEPHAA